MTLTPGSVAQSMGPRATSTLATMKRPPFEDSLESFRFCSAQSTTVMLGGGLRPARHDGARSSAWRSELGSSGLAELVEMLADILRQDLDQLAIVGLEIRRQGDHAHRPGQPGIAELARLV